MNTDNSPLRISGFYPRLSVLIRGCAHLSFRALAFCALASTWLQAADPVSSSSSDEAERLARYLRYPSLLRLTDTMLPMEVQASVLCARPAAQPTFIVTPPHTGASIRLYANFQAVDKVAMWTLDSRFPIGTLLVKEKFESKTSTAANLITVMEKVRDEGKVEDWLFTMISLPDRAIVRERPQVACTECHAKFLRTDFISGVTFGALRTYLSEKHDPSPLPELLKSSAPAPAAVRWEPAVLKPKD